MSFVDDVDSLKTKLHLRDMPTSLRIGLVLLGAIILFILFQGLWQLSSGDTHLIDGSAQSSWQEEGEEGLTGYAGWCRARKRRCQYGAISALISPCGRRSRKSWPL